MTTLTVIVNRPKADKAEQAQTVLQLYHRDYCTPGPTVGPLTVNTGGAYVWLGKPGCGEPIIIGHGESVLITCEEETP